MAVASLFMQAAGNVLGAYGSYKSGVAENEAAQYGAAVARNNAIVAENNAQLELARGNIMEQRARADRADGRRRARRLWRRLG